MESYQERVLTEKRDLDEKLTKLGAYLKKHPDDELLQEQFGIMVQYSSVLQKRIDAWSR